MREPRLCSGLLTFLQMPTLVCSLHPSLSVIKVILLTTHLGVIEDARFKRKEALTDLAQTVTKK